MSMIQGTTPTNRFNLPFDVSEVAALRIAYSQKGAVIFTKTEADCTLEGNTVTLRLTQEETFKFEGEEVVQIRLRVKQKDGNVKASKPVVSKIEESDDKEVM